MSVRIDIISEIISINLEKFVKNIDNFLDNINLWMYESLGNLQSFCYIKQYWRRIKNIPEKINIKIPNDDIIC